VPCDVTRLADEDYSREAAAYEHLQAVGQTGSFAPKYFGSWAFTTSIMIGERRRGPARCASFSLSTSPGRASARSASSPPRPHV
jgi:hypothetical protein